jgi:hypothetical protein
MRSSPKDTGASRRIVGQTAAGGAIFWPGSADWTVYKVSTGVVVIRFLKPFTTMPSVVATAWVGFAQVTAITGRQVTISTFNSAAAVADLPFMFSAEARE